MDGPARSRTCSALKPTYPRTYVRTWLKTTPIDEAALRISTASTDAVESACCAQMCLALSQRVQECATVRTRIGQKPNVGDHAWFGEEMGGSVGSREGWILGLAYALQAAWSSRPARPASVNALVGMPQRTLH
jgi:hypothetical protein